MRLRQSARVMMAALMITGGMLTGAISLTPRPAHADGNCGFWFTAVSAAWDNVHLDQMNMCNSSVTWMRAAANCPNGCTTLNLVEWTGSHWATVASASGGNNNGHWLYTDAVQAPCQGFPFHAQIGGLQTNDYAPC